MLISCFEYTYEQMNYSSPTVDSHIINRQTKLGFIISHGLPWEIYRPSTLNVIDLIKQTRIQKERTKNTQI